MNLPSRKEVIAAHKEQGGKVAAVYPIHYPRGLFRAFGILPIEVWGPPGIDTSQGEAHLQSYTCSIVRNGLSFLLSGGLEEVDMILVPHNCDSLQGLGSIMLDFTSMEKPVLTLYFPRSKRESDCAFFEQELAVLADRLRQLTGKSPTDADILTCIQLEEQADARIASIWQQRRQLSLCDAELYKLLRSREYLPAEQFIAAVDKAVADNQGEAPTGTPVLLSGITPEPMTLFDALAGMNALVVGDDLASCGRRLYPPGDSDVPLERTVESLLAGPPDFMIGASIAERVDYLAFLAEKSAAKGIIFYEVKFCEPELFQMPLLRKKLKQRGIPSTLVEIDVNDPLTQQTVTRMEAFVEMIA